MGFLDNNGLERLWTNIIAKLGNKVDKVSGKDLSSNDYTDEEKTKLQNIPDNLATEEYVDNSIKEYFVNVKTYGAVGDGVADDTNAIQTALNENKNVFIPNGTYLLTSPIAIWQHKTNLISHGTLLVNNCNAINITSNYCKIDLNDIVSVTEYTGCGIQLGGSDVYTYYNDIKVKNLYKLAEGLKIAPNGSSGVSYTSFTFKEINALKGIYFCPGSDSGSYINENYFTGGALICTNPIITEKNGAIDNFNGNKFEHISLEGCTNGIVLNSATYNRFNNCRMSKYENSDLTTFIILDKTSYGNVFNISTPLFVDKIIDNNEDGTPNEFCGDLRYIEDSIYLGTKCYSHNNGLYIKDSDRYYTFVDISDDIYNDYTLPYVIEGNTYFYNNINVEKELNVSNIYGYGRATFFFVSINNLTNGNLIINTFDGTTKKIIGTIYDSGIYRIECSDSGGWIISKLGIINDITDEEKEIISKAITVELDGTSSDEIVLSNADLLGGLPASDYALAQDVVTLNEKVGDTSIPNQVSTILDNFGALTIDLEDTEEGTVNLTNADLLKGNTPGYYTPSRNLLDNSDFTNPVNQRGETSYSGSGYTIDRWRSSSSDFVIDIVENEYITITNNSTTASSTFKQRLPTYYNKYIGKEITLAICTSDGTIKCTSGVIPELGSSSMECWVTINSSSYAYIKTSSVQIEVNIAVNKEGSVSLKWVALYEGSYTDDTLPTYVPKGYAAELAECQRYFFKVPGTSTVSYTGYSSTETNARITIMTPVPMRVTPTLTIGTISNVQIYTYNASKTATAVSVATKDGNAVTLDVTTSGLTAWTVCSARFNTAVELSADL